MMDDRARLVKVPALTFAFWLVKIAATTRFGNGARAFVGCWSVLVMGPANPTAPVPGQHTRAILVEHGYGSAEIDALLAQGVIAAA